MLSFDAPVSRFEPSFWEQLYSRKLNDYKLDDGKVDKKLYCHSKIHSFSKDSFRLPDHDTVRGSLIVLNTIEEFRDYDKKALLQREGGKMLMGMIAVDMASLPAAVIDPSILSSFTLLTFPDLKSYRFTYWFAAPVILPNASNPFMSAFQSSSPPIVPLKNYTSVTIRLYRTLLGKAFTNCHLQNICAYRSGVDGEEDTLLYTHIHAYTLVYTHIHSHTLRVLHWR